MQILYLNQNIIKPVNLIYKFDCLPKPLAPITFAKQL